MDDTGTENATKHGRAPYPGASGGPKTATRTEFWPQNGHERAIETVCQRLGTITPRPDSRQDATKADRSQFKMRSLVQKSTRQPREAGRAPYPRLPETRWSQSSFLDRSQPPPSPRAPCLPLPLPCRPCPTPPTHPLPSGAGNYMATHTGVGIQWDDADACHF